MGADSIHPFSLNLTSESSITSVMPNQLERYRRMKKENKSHWLWSRTLVMCECEVLPNAESGCWCDSSWYGMLSWTGKGRSKLRSVLREMTQVGMQVALDCYLSRQLPLKVGQVTSGERNTRALVVPSLCLHATYHHFFLFCWHPALFCALWTETRDWELI